VLTPAQIGAILNEVAWIYRNTVPRLGLQDKPGGTAAIQPRTGRSIWNGLRIVDAAGNHYGGDVCGACSVGRFEVVDAEFGGPTDPSLFVAPVEPEGATPEPEPTPQPPAGDIPALKARIAALELELAQVKVAEAQALQQLDAARAALEAAGIEVERLRHENEQTAAQAADLQRRLDAVRCEARPPWLRMLGARCEVIR
jgi:hypothetical protein